VVWPFASVVAYGESESEAEPVPFVVVFWIERVEVVEVEMLP
jgi:hypothetical protein